jgi:hypothetical protein
MTISRVSNNRFTKRTDAAFYYPFTFIKNFIKKIFENKTQKFYSFLSGKPNIKLNSSKIRLAYALNWSTGK